MKPLSIIVAVDECGGFSKNGTIPWSFKSDFIHFKEKTKDSVCIMGRKTYQDMFNIIKSRKKDNTPIKDVLVGRKSIVLSRSATYTAPGASTALELRQAVDDLDDIDANKEIFVIGGDKLFIEALPFTNKVYLTLIKGNYNCDKCFPLKYLNSYFKIVDGLENDDMFFLEYRRVRK